ncbi:MAG: HigA family addiction module antitoxin [Capsulimonadaceae bacterium]
MPTTSKSLTTTKPRAASPELRPGDWIPLTTPGEILREEFLDPMGISPEALAQAINIPSTQILVVLRGGVISPDLGVLLDRYFDMGFGFWSRVQADYSTQVARRKLADQIALVAPRQQPEENNA